MLFVRIQFDYLNGDYLAVLFRLVHGAETAAVQLLHEQVAVYVEKVFLVAFRSGCFLFERRIG